MNNFLLWYKKLKFNKKKKFISLFFTILPLVLSFSVVLNFFNTYYASFEEYNFQNTTSDIRVFTQYDNFQQIHNDIETMLNNRLHKGTFIKAPLPLSLNFTIYGSDSKENSFINKSIYLKGYNFSSNTFKDHYFSEFLSITSGKLPKNVSEVIVPVVYKDVYNLSLNTLINFQYKKEINSNLTVVGFYQKQGLSLISSNNGFIFLINDLNNQIFQVFKNIGFDIRYYFFLNHRLMDVFNTHSFTLEISNIKQSVEFIFSNLTPEYMISSSISIFQSVEFIVYINLIILDLFTILIPIFFFMIIFLVIFSNYFSRVETKIWNKIRYFLPKKKIKKNLIFDLIIDNFISYSIALPTAVGLNLFLSMFSNNKLIRLDIFIPTSYITFTIIILVVNCLVMYLFISKRLNMYIKNVIKTSHLSKPNRLNKPKKIIFILGIFVSLPIISIIFYFMQIWFNNPIQIIFTSILYGTSLFIYLIYSILVILIIVLLIPGLIIKIIQYISRIPFRKLKDYRYKLLAKFFDFKSITILIFITFLSLEMGFINYYHFRSVNKIDQEKLEIHLSVGSDIKISEPYSVNGTTDISDYIGHNQFCPINIIPGKIENNLIIEQNCVLLNFNSTNYNSVLNDKSRSSVSSEFITLVENLGINESLVPLYLKLRYDLKIGDSLIIHPQNASQYDGEIIKAYEKQIIIKEFFNFLPGLDCDASYYSTAYSENNLIIITSSHFNYSREFPNLPISQTFLVKNINNSINKIEFMVNNNTELRFRFLETELDKFNSSYSKISNNSIATIFWLFTIVFVLMSFLIIYNFIFENIDFWYLFQLFNLNKKDGKKFISWGLVGIFLISFFIGLAGFFSGIIISIFENMTLKNNYYFYPIELNFDQMGFCFNLIYIGISIVIIWFITNKLINLNLDYEKLRKYNPE